MTDSFASRFAPPRVTVALVGAALILAGCGTAGQTGATATPTDTVPPGPDRRPAAAASPSPGATSGAPSPGPGLPLQPPDIGIAGEGGWRNFGRGGGNNVVLVENRQDGRFRARGNAELDRIHEDEVTPHNVAQARSTCSDCQSVAAAIQVVLYRRGASVVAPVNQAIAINESCHRCVTVARAIQWVIPVDDPRDVPDDVVRLVRAIDREMRYFESIKDVASMDPREAESRLNRLEAEVASLDQYVNDMRDESRREADDTPTPRPGASPAAATATTLPSVTATPPASPSATSTPAQLVTPAASTTPAP